MRNAITFIVAATLVLAGGYGLAAACSTFCLEGNESLVFGKNYDWNVSDCLVMVNPSGVAKIANVENHPARWTSRWGSVTFNQYGREYPCGGMNEAGLVIELLWLDETDYPAADARAAVPSLQWIQYQLDNSATVDEVLASDSRIRIEGKAGRIHFLVADARGATAAVEFIGGELVAHVGESMPHRALTNDTYEKSLSYFLSGERTRSRSSLDRFALAADRAASYSAENDGDPISYAFATLDTVAQGSHTQWSIVYDIGARRVYARTQRNRAIRHLDLTRLDFSCEKPAQVVDLQAPFEGDLRPHLRPYTTADNFELMRNAFAATRFLAHIPQEEIRVAAQYPETISCSP